MLNQTGLSFIIKSTVYEEIETILTENNLQVDAISNDMKLNATLGITSLELARLVSVLDDKFSVSPFMELIPITSIRTIEDLIGAYQKAVNHQYGEKVA